MSDTECYNLANYATTMMSNDKVRSYQNDTWNDNVSGDFESLSAPYNVTNWNGVIHMGTKTFADELKLAKTIIHEAYHGYYWQKPGPDEEYRATLKESQCVI